MDSEEKLYNIPKEYLAGIEQGKRDIENNDFLTLEEFEKGYEKYLKD